MYFQLLKGEISKSVLSMNDLLKISGLVFHKNNMLSDATAQYLLEVFDVDKLDQEDIFDSVFLDFIAFLSKVSTNKQDKTTMDDFIGVGLKFAPFVNLGQNSSLLLIQVEGILKTPGSSINRIVVYMYIGLLVALSIDRYNKKEPFIEENLHEKFDNLLQYAKNDTTILEGLIQIYRFQIFLYDVPEFKMRISRINDFMEKTCDYAVIRSTYGFYNTHMVNSLVVSDQLQSNYDAYKDKLEKIYRSNPHDIEFKLLMYKVRLILQNFHKTRDIYTDFNIAFVILDDAIFGNLKCDLNTVIEAGMGIVYECFYSNFLQLMNAKNNFQGQLKRHKECRDKVFYLLQAFVSFTNDSSPSEPSLKATIRLEAYNLLLSVYLLISKDSMKQITYVYYYPDDKEIMRLKKYIDDLGKAKGKVSLQQEHKRYIKENFTDINDEDQENFKDQINKSQSGEIFENNFCLQEPKEEILIDVKGDHMVQKFVCCKTLELLKNCSVIFESSFNHIVVTNFFFKEGVKNYQKSVLKEYLITLLVKDTKNPEPNSFWTCYYRSIQLEHPLMDLLVFSRFFANIYLQTIYKSNIGEEKSKALFQNFANFLLTIMKLAFSTKKYSLLADVLQNVFLHKYFFKDNLSYLRILLYKVYTYRQNNNKPIITDPALELKFESLENHLCYMVGLFSEEIHYEIRKTHLETFESVKKEQLDMTRESPSSTGAKQEGLHKNSLYDDGYKMKRKPVVRHDLIKESNETTNQEMRRPSNI